MYAVALRGGVALLRRSLPAVGRTFMSRVGSSVGRKYAGKAIIAEAQIVKPSVMGKVAQWFKKPGLIRDITLWTGADYLLDKMFGSDDNEAVSTESQRLAVQQVLNQLADDDLGYSALRSATIIGERTQVTTTRFIHLQHLVERNLFRLGRIAGKVSSNDLVHEFGDLTDAEILFLNNQLVGLIKMISASSRKGQSQLLAARQSLCSQNPSPVISMGADIILDNRYNSEQVESIATQQNFLYEGLVEANCSTAYTELFDEGTKSFVDFFDMFGDDKMDEVDDEIIISMMLTHMNYKGSPTSFEEGILSWFRSFSVDSDGEDDESDAIRNLQAINRVHPRMERLVRSLLQGEDGRADSQLS